MGWFEYARLEPFGEERGDLRAGIIASTIANTHRDRRQKPTPYLPTDAQFMPFLDRSKLKDSRKPLTDASQWSALKRRIAGSAGAPSATRYHAEGGRRR
jgi:hypothetical protein